MEFVVRELADCLREAYVYVNLFEVENTFDKELVFLQQNVEFPGYRRGKVPFEIIEKNFSSKLQSQVFSALLSLAIDEINKTRQIESISNLEALTSLKRGEPFSFYVSFFESPSLLSEIDINNLTVEYEEYFYDEKILKEKISEFLLEYEEADGKIENKDKVFLNLLNEAVEKEKFENMEVEAERFPALIGKKKGDEVTLFLFDFGKYNVSNFLGKVKEPLRFKIVKVLKPKKLSLTDENVAKKTSFKTVEEYKENLAKSFDLEVERLNENSKRKALREYIAKNVTVSFNKYDFFKFLSSRFYRFFYEEMGNDNVSIKDIIEDRKMKDKYSNVLDEFYKEYTETMALTLLGKKLNIKPNQVYIDYILYDKAMRNRLSVEEMKQKISKEELSEMELFSLMNTLLDELVKKANFKVKNRLPYTGVS